MDFTSFQEDLHRPAFRTNLILFTLVLVALGFGLNILLAASSFLARQAYGDPYFYIKRQALFSLIGVAALFVAGLVAVVIGLLFLLAALRTEIAITNTGGQTI